MQQNEALSGRQARFVEALLASPSVKQASEVAQISRATAYRWLADPAVNGRYREALKALHQENMDTLIKLEKTAVKTLASMLEARSELVRVTAASKVLDHVAEAHKIAELETLLEELKERLPHVPKLRRIT